MKLGAYILSGNTIGLETTHWNSSDLYNNKPFILINDDTEMASGYTDISTIYGWGKFGENVLDYNKVRCEIKKLLPLSFSGLNENEIEIVEEFDFNKYYILYDYLDYRYHLNRINPTEPLINLNYDLLGLHKKRTFDKGEILSVEYYGKHDYFNNTYDDLIIKEERIYSRLNHMVYKRDMAIHWMYNDGTTGFTKNTVKYYTTEEGIRAGETRRGNVITNLKITVVGLLMAASGITSVVAQEIGRPFINSYSNEISKYIQGYEDELKDSITGDVTYDWLDLEIPNTGGITIRQYLISELTIDYTINNININA